MLYERRHTHLIKEFGGLATPMPAFSAFFLFVCLSSLGLPMLNGFVGEFLILMGTFQRNVAWAAFAATGVILSAVYLLWAYQRAIYGDVTIEKNRALADLSRRERIVLWPICVLILLMGVASPVFLSRTEATSQRLLELMRRDAPALADKHGVRELAPALPFKASTIEEQAPPRSESARAGGTAESKNRERASSRTPRTEPR
jgi:NADH-quinone oxidoreductase subunit M